MKVSLRALRANKNMTQKEVACAVGVSARTITNWENGVTSPTWSQLLKLCDVYSASPNDIFLPDPLAKSE